MRTGSQRVRWPGLVAARLIPALLAVALLAVAGVELITIAGAGHQWPGATPNPLAQRLLHTDPPSTALNATQVIWQFFAAHAR